MAPLALAYSVIQQGGGAGSLGLVLATNTVPTIVFLLMGGLFADRLSRSRFLFVGNFLAAGAQGALAVTVATGHATTASIAACGFVSGTALKAPFGVVPAEQERAGSGQGAGDRADDGLARLADLYFSQPLTAGW